MLFIEWLYLGNTYVISMRIVTTAIAGSLLTAILFCTQTNAAVLEGRVTRVIDGDKLEATVGGRTVGIRLRGIDAPELNQEFGEEAERVLQGLLEGMPVLISTDSEAYEAFIIGSVATEGTDAGLYMLERGYAWLYQNYAHQIPSEWQRAYEMAESEAKAAHEGLWQAQGQVPPWSWRKQKREARLAEEAETKETLEGITEDLRSNLTEIRKGVRDLKEGFGSDDISQTDLSGSRKLDDDNRNRHWWELCIKLGEDVSRWLKAFVTSFFD